MSAEKSNRRTIASEQLPERYDRLVPIEQLRHGKHNPRRVPPKDSLRRSIANDGINRPLIVHPDANADEEYYHITDGWQRYQAATACGWEKLPVRIFETPLAALNATEIESIVREWSTYEWAQYCQSLRQELDPDPDPNCGVATKVAEQTTRTPQTIRRYLDVLSLPDEIHPLLNEGPPGSEQDWKALQHYNEDVRRYDGLSWRVAERLARRQSEMSRSRVVATAAKAVVFDTQEDALEFIERAGDAPETPLSTIRKQVLFGTHHDRYLEVPRVAIQLEEEKKQAIMDHCHQTRQSLSDIVASQIRSLATDVTD